MSKKVKLENLNTNSKLSKYIRPSWDEYFMKFAALVAERSTCHRHHVGAIIVNKKRILTTGYNGAGIKLKDCLELGCIRNELSIPSGQRHEICRAIHAEQNAIIQAGLYGIKIEDSTMYCTHTPCMICSKMIVNSKIKEVVIYQKYSDKDAQKYLEDAGIKIRIICRPSDQIKFLD